MDETPVYFDMVPGKTIHKKGAKTIKIRTTGKIFVLRVTYDVYQLCFYVCRVRETSSYSGTYLHC